MSNPSTKDSFNAALGDIPPARRQSIESVDPAIAPTVKPQANRSKVPLGWLGLAGLGAGIIGLGFWQWDNVTQRAEGIKTAITASNPLEKLGIGKLGGDISRERAQNPQGELAHAEDLPPEELLNHRRYEEADPESLVALHLNSQIKLKPAAQAKVNEMIDQAQAEGVQLGVISGFRTLEDQNYLFFEVKAERGETSRTRAEVSAPPGYSEHHTGYAVDFIDKSRPETDIEESFATTAAYRWLVQNAAFYDFEMSFPKSDDSQLSYEPWHWRYVGDQESLEIFYRE
ncbi:MAG: D-alanyl-D-alanine carboxypeptidase family protein [Phormidesmis sp. RL_2_1]|nr:D-alanyl-D-alanine carboxypeptidase family protein [Phormidesmis sp. RL_2_1]